MVLIRRGVIAPEEDLLYTQQNANVLNVNENLGKGTFYVAKSGICFMREDGQGFFLTFDDIGAVGVSGKQEGDFPEDCLFIMTSILYAERDDRGDNGPGNGPSGGDNDSEDDEECPPYEYLYVFPNTKDDLQTMYEQVLVAQKAATRNEPGGGLGGGMGDNGELIEGNNEDDDEEEEEEYDEEDNENYEDAEDEPPNAENDIRASGDMAVPVLEEPETFQRTEVEEPMDFDQFEDAGS